MHLVPAVDPSVPDHPPRVDLSGVLLDGMAEALLYGSTSQRQSTVVLALVTEIHAAAVWLLDDPGGVEVASLNRVLAAAVAHRDLMRETVKVPAIADVPSSAAPAGPVTVFADAAEMMIMSA